MEISFYRWFLSYFQGRFYRNFYKNSPLFLFDDDKGELLILIMYMKEYQVILVGYVYSMNINLYLFITYIEEILIYTYHLEFSTLQLSAFHLNS